MRRIFTGKRVMVLGGGNVAVDVARTAVRLGASEVHMAFLESRNTMPAHSWEIEATEAEGVILHPARSFERIVDDGQGRVAGLESLKVTSMEFSPEGQLRLETQPGSRAHPALRCCRSSRLASGPMRLCLKSSGVGAYPAGNG